MKKQTGVQIRAGKDEKDEDDKEQDN